MSTAAQCVLALPELLADILVHLPFDDVMRSRGVSKTWLGVIDTSPEILWNTWRSPTAPKSAQRQTPSGAIEFEPFKPFFEKTLINTDEWITGISPVEPPPRVAQRQFIRRSLQEFIAKNAENLRRFYITRPPLKKIKSSIKVITAGRSSLQTSFDHGFTVGSDDGKDITVDMYLRALLSCLETSWGKVNLKYAFESPGAPGPNTAAAATEVVEEWTPDLVVKKRKHRLETQLLTMKRECFDEDGPQPASAKEWENGAMSSTLIIKVQVSETSVIIRPQPPKSWWTELYDIFFGG
ncbi:hypothetical protein DRE_01492 [Drechslerella stenobrocha 248]|uniref:Uncharacterized protein n=1 Tax=Drechslerella stenobrocha 248 TaxID=1043628 RepID=W7I4F6_9PEZI|nr:hypothetical protein DRE_01492 [Drechslerella stenobrocha 248]